ncbi:uncharacterized protein LOC107039310 [Diachasma alloeum]|uniref:uncharacterized protein LOC107039310 n=1 Tax=Diachasma alloeum TaxID=454923 RepID=UPI0007384E1C|nr:uncharacterized protein LOC107039310 [Diachasma alloeum]
MEVDASCDFDNVNKSQAIDGFSLQEIQNDRKHNEGQIEGLTENQHSLTTAQLDSHSSMLDNHPCLDSLASKIEPNPEGIQLNDGTADLLTEEQSLPTDELYQNNVQSHGDREDVNIKKSTEDENCSNSSRSASKISIFHDEDSIKLSMGIESVHDEDANRCDEIILEKPMQLRDELEQKQIVIAGDEENSLHVDSMNTNETDSHSPVSALLTKEDSLEPKTDTKLMEVSLTNEATEPILENKPSPRDELEQEKDNTDNQRGDKIVSISSELPVVVTKRSLKPGTEEFCGLVHEKQSLSRDEPENEELNLEETPNALGNSIPNPADYGVMTTNDLISSDNNTRLEDQTHSIPLTDKMPLKNILGMKDIVTDSKQLVDTQKMLSKKIKILELLKSKRKKKKIMEISEDSESTASVSEEKTREKNGWQQEKVNNDFNYSENSSTSLNDSSSPIFNDKENVENHSSNLINVDRVNASSKNVSDDKNVSGISGAKLTTLITDNRHPAERSLENETIGATSVLQSSTDSLKNTVKEKAKEKMEIQVTTGVNRSMLKGQNTRPNTNDLQAKRFAQSNSKGPIPSEHLSTEESMQERTARIHRLRELWKLKKRRELQEVFSWRKSVAAEIKKENRAYWMQKKFPKLKSQFILDLEQRLTAITKRRQKALALKAKQEALALKAELQHLAERKKLKNLKQLCLQFIRESTETSAVPPQSPLRNQSQDSDSVVADEELSGSSNSGCQEVKIILEEEEKEMSTNKPKTSPSTSRVEIHNSAQIEPQEQLCTSSDSAEKNECEDNDIKIIDVVENKRVEEPEFRAPVNSSTPMKHSQPPAAIPQSPLTPDNKSILIHVEEESHKKYYPKDRCRSFPSFTHFSLRKWSTCSYEEKRLEFIEEAKRTNDLFPNCQEPSKTTSEHLSTPQTSRHQSTVEQVSRNNARNTEDSSSADKYCSEKASIICRISSGSIPGYSSASRPKEPNCRKRGRSQLPNDVVINPYCSERQIKKPRLIVEMSRISGEDFDELETSSTAVARTHKQIMDKRGCRIETTITPGNNSTSSSRNRHIKEEVEKCGEKSSTKETLLKKLRKSRSNPEEDTAFEVIDLMDD